MPPFKQPYRFKVVISGKVQGVWFRKHTQETASSLELTGWVRNEIDGNVQTEFQGEYQNCIKMLKWLENGSPLSAVTNLKIEQLESRVSEASFQILV